MSAFSSNRPSIRLKAIPRIPAKLKATGGLKFEKSGDVWTITPDFGALNLVTNFPDVSNNQVWLFNPVTGVYVRSTMQTILDALSIATAPDLEAAIAAAQAAQAGAESARDDTQNIADQAQTDISNAEASAVAAVGAAQTTAENSLNAILAAADVMIVYDHAPLNTEGEDGWFALDTSEARVGVYGPKTAGAWGARRGYVIGLDGTGTVNGPVSSVAHHLAGFSNTGGNLLEDSGVAVSTDTTLASNSDAKLPTEKAVKAYVDGIIAAQDAMVFKGVQDCSANPNYPAANRGDTYRVSVAGKIGGSSGVVVEVGDIFICLDDSTSSGNQAAVGSHWTIVQTNIDGAVVGPSSATDGRFALFDGATGKLLKQASGAPGDAAYKNTGTSAGTLAAGDDNRITGAAQKAGNQNLTGGFTTDTYDNGSQSGSGTLTPSPLNGAIQKCVNHGAWTLAPYTMKPHSMILDITNDGSAGTITTSSFTKKTGDSFDTTNAHKFRCFITYGDAGSHLHVQAMF